MFYNSLVIMVCMILFGSKEVMVGMGNCNEFCLMMNKVLIFFIWRATGR